MFDKLVIFHIINKKSSFVPIAAIRNNYAKTVVLFPITTMF